MTLSPVTTRDAMYKMVPTKSSPQGKSANHQLSKQNFQLITPSLCYLASIDSTCTCQMHDVCVICVAIKTHSAEILNPNTRESSRRFFGILMCGPIGVHTKRCRKKTCQIEWCKKNIIFNDGNLLKHRLGGDDSRHYVVDVPHAREPTHFRRFFLVPSRSHIPTISRGATQKEPWETMSLQLASWLPPI